MDTQVLTVSADKTAKLWNISADGSGTVTTTFSLEGDGGVRDMQVGCLWLNDYLISISLGGKLSYLSQANPTLPPKVISGHLKSITAITLATNGGKTEIISSSYDAVIIRWTMGTGYLGRLEIGDLLPTVKNLVIADQQVYLYGLDKQVRQLGHKQSQCHLIKSDQSEVETSFRSSVQNLCGQL